MLREHLNSSIQQTIPPLTRENLYSELVKVMPISQNNESKMNFVVLQDKFEVQFIKTCIYPLPKSVVRKQLTAYLQLRII